ncbi:MAG: PmbA/TldA family metallopeptidase, partial [bacterium]
MNGDAMNGDAMACWSPVAADETERALLEVGDLALNRADELGASMAEVSVGQEQGVSVTVRNGAVETVERNRDKSLAVTVHFGRKSGSASTTDFSAAAIRESVASACNIAKFTEEDACGGLPERELLATEFPDLDLNHPWQLPMERAIEIATDCERAALRFDRRISNTEGATLSSHHGVDLYANSIGFKGLSRGSRHSLGCSVIAGEGDAMQRDYWYDAARDAADLRAPIEVGAEAARRTARRLGARRARPGEYPMLFEP